jgi:3-hydroxybutyryl-CoA dehydrogenase
MPKVGFIGLNKANIALLTSIVMSGEEVFCLSDGDTAILQNKLAVHFGVLMDNNTLNVSDFHACINRVMFVNELTALHSCEILFMEGKGENKLEDISNIPASITVILTSFNIKMNAVVKAQSQRENVIGLHAIGSKFSLTLAEVIVPTSVPVILYESIKKYLEEKNIPVVYTQNRVGFIVSKVLSVFYGEAIRMLEEGVADAKNIDYAFCALGNYKKGPFILLDEMGIDYHYKQNKTLWKACHYDDRYKPSSLEKNMVQSNFIGTKTKNGFYNYLLPTTTFEPSEEEAAQHEYIYKRILCMVINEAADTVQTGIATAGDVDLALKAGADFPHDILVLAEELGYEEIIYTLDNLYDRYHEMRYRVSPYLRDRVSLL